MEVVKYIEAAKMAGVSRQAIHDMKKVNSLRKGKYPFFVYDPQTGEAGIDVKHPDWLYYLEKRKTRSVKSSIKKQPSNRQVMQLTKEIEKKDATIIVFVQLCISSAQSIFKPDKETMDKFKEKLTVEYNKLRDNKKESGNV